MPKIKSERLPKITSFKVRLKDDRGQSPFGPPKFIIVRVPCEVLGLKRLPVTVNNIFVLHNAVNVDESLDKETWVVSEFSTGFRVSFAESKGEAIKVAKQRINYFCKTQELFDDLIKREIARFGIQEKDTVINTY